ncbi:MAG: hypothetical protein JW727_04935 [Candidatus Aenigmarchaeota archaeon]|nr:hypothetical protein [Candidatus Aenigmarchaeota archaeon]
MGRVKGGLFRGVGEAVMGVITLLIIEGIAAYFLPAEYILLFKALLIVGLVVLLAGMKYWSTSYSLGWLLGVFAVASYTGLFSFWDVMVYLAIPVIVLAKRAMK